MGTRLTWIFLFLTYFAGLHIITSKIYLTGSQSYLENDQPFTLTCRSDSVPFGTSAIFLKDGIGIFNVVYAASLSKCYGVPQNGNPTSFECTNNCSCSADLKSYTWTYTGTDSKRSVVFRCTMAANGTQTIAENLTVEVIYAPDATPVLTQFPQRPIISGDKVTLTCSVSGGNPLAVLSWNCSGNIINKTSENTASYSVDFIVDKTDNNRICTCSGSHSVTSYKPTVHHRLVVYYAPVTSPNIQQSPAGVIFDGDIVTLTCSVSGGNPLPILSWNCTGININTTSGDTASYEVKFTIDRSSNANTCTCSASHPVTSYRPVVYTRLEVVYAPATTPIIIQSPHGPIISGNKVTLTCLVSGGNPLAVLSWNCSGNNNNNTSGNTASYSVDFTVDRTYNNIICTCSGSHSVTSYRPTVHHRLVVYYAPGTAPTIQQTPDGPIVPGDKVMLTCTAPGGNPLAVLSWDCNGTVTNHTSENTASYSVEFTTDTTYNNKICNCSATHIVTSYRPSVQHKLEVYCSPRNMQIHDGRGLFTAGISSLVIGLLALILAIVLIACWRFRMTKTSKSPDHYTEFNTKSSTETVAYDVINQTTNIGKMEDSEEEIEYLLNFLKKRGIDEDSVEKLKTEKIDCSTVTSLSDEQLQKFIPKLGDIHATKRFCNDFVKKKGQKKRTQSLIAKFRKKTKLPWGLGVVTQLIVPVMMKKDKETKGVKN